MISPAKKIPVPVDTVSPYARWPNKYIETVKFWCSYSLSQSTGILNHWKTSKNSLAIVAMSRGSFKTFWTHHLSDSKTKTVTDFFVAMHLRIVCDNFCKSLVMMEVFVVGENSWVSMEFFFTESSSLSVITQTVCFYHSFSIPSPGLSSLALIFSLNMRLQLFANCLEVL